MSLLKIIDPKPGFEPEISKPDAEMLVSGDPVFKTWAYDASREETIHSGVWEATPGQTWARMGTDFEFCHILQGVIELTEEGQAPVRLKAGDSFIMKPGFKAVWRTIETVRKIYVIVE